MNLVYVDCPNTIAALTVVENQLREVLAEVIVRRGELELVRGPIKFEIPERPNDADLHRRVMDLTKQFWVVQIEKAEEAEALEAMKAFISEKDYLDPACGNDCLGCRRTSYCVYNYDLDGYFLD